MDSSPRSEATYATSIPDALAEIPVQAAVSRFYNTSSFGSSRVFAND